MSDSEFKAMLDLLAALVFSGRTGVLMLILVAVAVMDYRSYRIPNWLVLAGAAYAIVFNTVFPPLSHGTMLFPLAGLGLGLLLFLPLYLLRAMGAGDVKLLAMTGAFLGPLDTFHVALASVLVGGVLSILIVFGRGMAVQTYRNLKSVLGASVVQVMGASIPSLRIPAQGSAGKLPYGVVIAIGTSGYLVMHQLGFFN